MSAIAVEVRVDKDVLDAIQRDIPRHGKLLEKAFRRQVTRVRRLILDALSEEPGAPQYPLRWKSRKQQHYVMAKLRAEGNLPYQRTHALSQGWDAVFEVNDDGGVLNLTNDQDYAGFVQGDDAQPFHLDTGWTQVAEVVAKYNEDLTDRLIDTWFVVTDLTAGV